MVLHKTSDGLVGCDSWDALCTNFLGEGRFRWYTDWVFAADGTYFYGMNGTTGIITYGGSDDLPGGAVDGTDAAAVLQAMINGATEKDIIFIRNGTYDLGTTQITATGVNLLGQDKRMTTFQYQGTDYAFVYNGNADQQNWYQVKNFRIYLNDTDPVGGLKLIDRCFYFDVVEVFVHGTDGGNQIGFLLDAENLGVHWNNFTRCRTRNVEQGIQLTANLDLPNSNRFTNCVFREPEAGGYGINIDSGRTNMIIGCSAEGNNAFTGFRINDDFNAVIACAVESTGVGSVGFDFTANSQNCVFLAGRGNVTTAGIQDAGTNNRLGRSLSLWTLENCGTAQIANPNTSVVVAHGLAIQPTAQEINVVPTNNLGNATKWWISNVGATNFTINIDVAHGTGNAEFAWNASLVQ